MKNTKNNVLLESALIGLKLLLICAIIAGVVSFVYALTIEQYEINLQKAKDEAIGNIFGKQELACTPIGGAEGMPVYEVREGSVLIGYCVESTSAGFGGSMGLMIGYDSDLHIVGVEIISHSETPGLGSKAAEPGFLGQFNDQQGILNFGADIDAISGATISSTAVLDGVNAATQSLEAVLMGGGAENE